MVKRFNRDYNAVIDKVAFKGSRDVDIDEDNNKKAAHVYGVQQEKDSMSLR